MHGASDWRGVVRTGDFQSALMTPGDSRISKHLDIRSKGGESLARLPGGELTVDLERALVL
eukprot:5709396-Pyramimonas_sp.AAC.1